MYSCVLSLIRRVLRVVCVRSSHLSLPPLRITASPWRIRKIGPNPGSLGTRDLIRWYQSSRLHGFLYEIFLAIINLKIPPKIAIFVFLDRSVIWVRFGRF